MEEEILEGLPIPLASSILIFGGASSNDETKQLLVNARFTKDWDWLPIDIFLIVKAQGFGYT